MIQLNLLPSKVRAAEQLRVIILVGIVVYLGAGLFIAFRYTQARARTDDAKRQLAVVEAQLAEEKRKGFLDKVNAYKANVSAESAKASQVNTYRKQQVALLRLLDAMPDWVQEHGVWLSKFTIDTTDNKVALEGEAMDSLSFARFYTLLEGQPLVSNLAMPNKTTTVTVRGWTVPHFALTFKLAVPL